MTPDDHKAIIRDYVDTVWNRQRLDRADDFVAVDFTDHAASPQQAPGLTGARQKWAMFQAAVPDLNVTIEDMVAEGDRVAVRRTYTGTHRGPMFGVPATGNTVHFPGFSIFRLAAGRIAEHWELFDRLTLMQQLGAIAGQPTSPPTPR
jgi:steroid delta-isomerase-like uncharacterized protein